MRHEFIALQWLTASGIWVVFTRGLKMAAAEIFLRMHLAYSGLREYLMYPLQVPTVVLPVGGGMLI